MRRTLLRLALTAACVAGLSAHVLADNTVGLCIKAASSNYKECKGDCKEDFQVAKDACINKDHDCVEACRELRSECVDDTGFAGGIKACNQTMDGQIANCKQIYPPDSTDRDTCIDDAQVAGFVCRQGVRKSTKDALNACRKGDPSQGIQGFRPCVAACPAGSGPVDDPKQCRHDASQDDHSCNANCREDFQFGKDTCRNKDHDCVESCRADRESCQAPVQATLDQAVAQCRANKNAAVAACNGDPTCIEQALVVAFQCRDSARETAKPGFAACRAGFKSCAQACPPAASPSGAFLD